MFSKRLHRPEQQFSADPRHGPNHAVQVGGVLTTVETVAVVPKSRLEIETAKNHGIQLEFGMAVTTEKVQAMS